MKNISILGSTGSIGTQALDVIRNDNNYSVKALSTNVNIDLLEKQINEFNPSLVAVFNEEKAKELKRRLIGKKIEIMTGMEGLKAVSSEEDTEILLTSVVGTIGLQPTMEAINKGKTIALANKETLVTAGKIVMEKAKEKNVNILPVDSEHSAIFQCLNGENKDEVKNLILTASGGPFRGKNKLDLQNVKPSEALKHPNWSMGKKISIDSATLMNKGLEVIEAKWLFNVEIENIKVVIHPQSIIHSMVEFVDGSIMAQLGISDMRIPIQYALTYPNRVLNSLENLDLIKISKMTFEEPDITNFPCLSLAISAIKEGGTMPTVLNSGNEELVQYYLDGFIGFNDIPKYIEKLMNLHKNITNPSLDDILEIDKWSRRIIKDLI